MSTALPRLRGAIRSPAHKAFATAPHRPANAPPPTFLCLPATLSMWGNDYYGDCVSAEEAAAKAMFSSAPYAGAGVSELVIPDQTLIHWAAQYGFLNGAMLTDVLDAMVAHGITVNGTTYKDGPYNSVDWTNDTVLSSAIVQGPVKIGVAAAQLERAGAGNANGWVGTGFRKDNNLDHCVNLCGFGTMQWLCQQLGVQVPAGVNPTVRAYALFTWSTIGIIDQQSMIAITGEAWLRNPTTPGQPVPTPTPDPVPTPTPPPIPPSPIPPDPTPTPVPTPTPEPGTLIGQLVGGSLMISGFTVAQPSFHGAYGGGNAQACASVLRSAVSPAGILQQIIAFIQAVGGNISASINIQEAESIVMTAFATGGIAAVIPALIANVSTWVTDPIEAPIVVALLTLLQRFI